jgi:uncharacterized membrane protein YfcA
MRWPSSREHGMSDAPTLFGLALLPPDLSAWVAGILIGTSFFTSAIAAALGLGGGLLMLAVLANFLAPASIIPVHGVIQIGSNLGRAALMRQAIVTALAWPFALGSIVGAALGALVVTTLPTEQLLLILGLFILWSCWSPKLRPTKLPERFFALVGAVTSFVSMFLGATGPFIAAFFDPERLTRHQIVATHATCMTIQHSFKVAAFVAVGFAFAAWLPLLLAMILSGFLGTMAGRRRLDRMPDAHFGKIFRTVLTLLALRLIYDAASRMLA